MAGSLCDRNAKLRLPECPVAPQDPKDFPVLRAGGRFRRPLSRLWRPAGGERAAKTAGALKAQGGEERANSFSSRSTAEAGGGDNAVTFAVAAKWRYLDCDRRP